MKFNRKKFFDGFREHIDATIEKEQVDGLEFLLGQIESDPFWKHIPQISYALATTYHETAGSMQPVEEAYYLEKQVSKAFMLKVQKGFRYYPYFGRGYPQTTWLTNYKRADRELKKQKPELVAQFEAETKQKLDLINKPEQMKHPLIAYATMTLGMHQGWFTGKKLDDFIKGSKKDYTNARTIINGHDKAGLIAGYARAFEKILLDSAAITETPTSGIDSARTSSTQPAESAADSLAVPLVPVTQPVVEVPQVSASTETPQEDTLTKIGNKANAAYTAFAGVGAGLVAWFSTASGIIVLSVVGAVTFLGLGYMVINAIRAERKERRDFDAKMEREKQAHELQLYTLRSAAEQHLQAVTIAAPPATEISNADSNGGNA